MGKGVRGEGRVRVEEAREEGCNRERGRGREEVTISDNRILHV